MIKTFRVMLFIAGKKTFPKYIHVILWHVNAIFEVFLILINAYSACRTFKKYYNPVVCKVIQFYLNTPQYFTKFSNKWLGVKDKISFTLGETLGSFYHNRHFQNALESIEETKCIYHQTLSADAQEILKMWRYKA